MNRAQINLTAATMLATSAFTAPRVFAQENTTA